MIVQFGNLAQPRHSEDPEKPDAKARVTEMMDKLHEAGFKRVTTIADIDKEPKSYHVYDLPHQIYFSSDVQEAVKIMTPYSDYMQPVHVVG